MCPPGGRIATHLLCFSRSHSLEQNAVRLGLLNQLAKVFCRGKEENEQLKELARKKKQKREKEA